MLTIGGRREKGAAGSYPVQNPARSAEVAFEAPSASLPSRLAVGTVWVNHHGTGAVDPRVPFGRWKQSGIGLKLGVDGVLALTRHAGGQFTELQMQESRFLLVGA